LQAFAPLARVPGVRLISLQKNVGIEQLAGVPPEMTVETLGDDFDAGTDAFVDTVAVMMNLDLVITSDTAIAHLAGALGRTVWIAMRHVPDWRWIPRGETTPWYPSARLFLQSRLGAGWDEVFDRMAHELARLAGTPASADARMPLVPISIGELIDRMTILEIKAERIDDADKVANVRRELDLLAGVRGGAALDGEVARLKQELRAVNELLWEIEDLIRACEREQFFGDEFIALARGVYKTNDRRSALKRQINELSGSAIVEEKAYTQYS
jgi:hypothetical protein